MPISKVGSKGIKDAELSAADIAPGTITSDKIASGTIANDRLAGSIANDKLANSNITINGTSINLGASGEIVAGADWQSVIVADGSTATTAVAGRGYIIDTSSAAHTINLPSSPSAGDFVAIINSGSNTITIGRGGSNIKTIASDTQIDTNGAITLVYSSSASIGWVMSNQDTPGIFTEATGGTVSTSGNYKIHTFNSSSNFVVAQTGNKSSNPLGGPATVEYLVVAGGGGGGTRAASGAGAGGYRTNYPSPDDGGLSVTAQTYPITVGAGGTVNGPTNNEVPGNQGANSIFSTITSAGGGGGKGGCTPYEPVNPRSNGGSGGGGGPSGPGGPLSTGGTGNTPPVSPPQGNPGGNNTGVYLYNGAGGGGASAAGANARPSAPGNGGAGSPNSISGSNVTYAGGGGGGSWPSPNGAAGGVGGAGGGGHGRPGLANPAPGNPAGPKCGSANTGGGGGGEGGGDAQLGGVGGSGIVIIRYRYQ